MDGKTQEQLSKLKSELVIQMDKTAQEYGNALGRALKQRFKALEAIVAILATSAPLEVQKRIEQEIANHRAFWLK